MNNIKKIYNKIFLKKEKKIFVINPDTDPREPRARESREISYNLIYENGSKQPLLK